MHYYSGLPMENYSGVDILSRIAGHPASRLDELLPWNWIAAKAYAQAA